MIKGGLTHNQAQERLRQYGFNEIKEGKNKTWLSIVFDQFNSPLVWLLFGAVVVAFFIGDVLDSVLILLILVVNAVLGFVQEYKAEDAMKKLKKLGVARVRVIRSEREIEIDSREIVPGDLIFLEEGIRIVADGKVVEGNGLEIDESILTGESMAVAKSEAEEKGLNLVFQGTMVARGKGWMIAEKTGMETKFGKLAGSLKTIKEPQTPLDKKLSRLGRLMMAMGLVAGGIVVTVVGIGRGDMIEGLLTGVSLAVAVIPEGLPAVIAVTLALGVERMARQKAVVRRLAAVESLGSTTVIATDKTGTITKNEMEVKEIELNSKIIKFGHFPDLGVKEYTKLLMAGVLCNGAVLENHPDGGSIVLGDQTEGALLKLAQTAGLVPGLVREKVKEIAEYPFESKFMSMAVVVEEEDGDKWVYVKGSPERIWEKCVKSVENRRLVKVSQKWRQEIEKLHDQMASSGLRVIGLAYKRWSGEKTRSEVEKDLVWLGMVGIADPLRPEVSSILDRALKAGVRILMVTGDNALTAKSIGVEAGMVGPDERVVSGEEVEKYTPLELKEIVKSVKIFSRVKPDDKLKIIEALQAEGETVVMTGDGVNDALALKKADVGVAMGRSGSDVARETADLILLDDNLATLVNAVESGRVIIGNIGRVVKYLLACNIGEMIAIVGAVVLGWEVPLLPVQILWVNLVTDGLPALALTTDKSYEGIMKGRVQSQNGWYLQTHDKWWIAAVGLIVGVTTLVFFELGGRMGSFWALVVTQLVVVLAVRNWRRPNRWLIGSIAIGLILQMIITVNPALREIFKI